MMLRMASCTRRPESDDGHTSLHPQVIWSEFQFQVLVNQIRELVPFGVVLNG